MQVIAGVIPPSLQLQAQVKLASLERESRECAISYALRSLCFCSRSGGGANILLFQ
jgi:hypothetical protein